MNTILERSQQMQYHTDMRLVFEAIQGRQNQYNWLITNIACNYDPDSRIQYPYLDYVWLTGEELTEIVCDHDIQFIWGVFSGFNRSISFECLMKFSIPYADGNHELWTPSPQVQHPLATVEIVAWDSTLTLIISRDDEISLNFRNFFSDARDLNEYNRK